MSNEDFVSELKALRQNLPTVVQETAGGQVSRPTKTADVRYSIGVAERICDYILQGKSLHWISENVSEMPGYSTLIRWSQSNAEFSKLIRATRETRARLFEEKAIEAAEEAYDPKDVPAASLKFNAYKWAAEVNDPSTYGKKVEHKGSIDQKVTYTVITGFEQPNEWQTPPKLRADGTIDKESKAAAAAKWVDASPAPDVTEVRVDDRTDGKKVIDARLDQPSDGAAEQSSDT